MIPLLLFTIFLMVTALLLIRSSISTISFSNVPAAASMPSRLYKEAEPYINTIIKGHASGDLPLISSITILHMGSAVDDYNYFILSGQIDIVCDGSVVSTLSDGDSTFNCFDYLGIPSGVTKRVRSAEARLERVKDDGSTCTAMDNLYLYLYLSLLSKCSVVPSVNVWKCSLLQLEENALYSTAVKDALTFGNTIMYRAGTKMELDGIILLESGEIVVEEIRENAEDAGNSVVLKPGAVFGLSTYLFPDCHIKYQLAFEKNSQVRFMVSKDGGDVTTTNIIANSKATVLIKSLFATIPKPFLIFGATSKWIRTDQIKYTGCIFINGSKLVFLEEFMNTTAPSRADSASHTDNSKISDYVKLDPLAINYLLANIPEFYKIVLESLLVCKRKDKKRKVVLLEEGSSTAGNGDADHLFQLAHSLHSTMAKESILIKTDDINNEIERIFNIKDIESASHSGLMKYLLPILVGDMLRRLECQVVLLLVQHDLLSTFIEESVDLKLKVFDERQIEEFDGRVGSKDSSTFPFHNIQFIQIISTPIDTNYRSLVESLLATFYKRLLKIILIKYVILLLGNIILCLEWVFPFRYKRAREQKSSESIHMLLSREFREYANGRRIHKVYNNVRAPSAPPYLNKHHLCTYSNKSSSLIDLSNSASGRFKFDCIRLSRYLTDRRVGLVLGGGGARGYAHVGVLRALEDAGISVDIIGGTSMGALVGSLYCIHMDSVRVYTRVKQFSRFMSSFLNMMVDLTYPFVSMFSGVSVDYFLKKLFTVKQSRPGALTNSLLGRTKQGSDSTKSIISIEDCNIPFYCVTTNLGTNAESVHTTGPLSTFVRASMSICGYLPPVFYNNTLLVDGAYTNNVPVDVMRQMDVDNIISVDVSRESSVKSNIMFDAYEYGEMKEKNTSNVYNTEQSAPISTSKFIPYESRSGLILAFGRYFKSKAYMTLQEIQYTLTFLSNSKKSIELYSCNSNNFILHILPDLEKYKTTDFHKYDEIVAVGYESAKRAIEKWKINQSEHRFIIRKKNRRKTI